MARLRVFVANGGDVYELYMKRKRAAANEARAVKADREIIRKRKLAASHETIGNITILNIGKKTWASQLLKSVRDT